MDRSLPPDRRWRSNMGTNRRSNFQLRSDHPLDASSEVHLRSSLQSLHDVIQVPPFNHNVHHRGLWTEAAYGSLKPPPTRRLRRTYLHLSYSMTIARLHDTSMVKIFDRAENKNDLGFL